MEGLRRILASVLAVLILNVGSMYFGRSAGEETHPVTVVIKISESNNSVCLICPAYQNTSRLKWILTSSNVPTVLFMYNVRRYKDDSLSLAVNNCHESNYSLEVAAIPVNTSDEVYTCLRGANPLANFEIIMQATPRLQITREQYFTIEHTNGTGGIRVSELRCDVSNAAPPFTLIWRMNDSENKRAVSVASAEYTSTLRINESSVPDNITCSVYGPRIVNQSASLVLQPTRDSKIHGIPDVPDMNPATVEHHGSPLIPVGSLLVVVVVSAVVCIGIYMYRRSRNGKTPQRRLKDIRNVRDTLPKVPGEKMALSEPEECYADISDYATRINAALFE